MASRAGSGLRVQSSLKREDEIDLARRLQGGDAAAFDAFVAHFRSKIFHYSWLMCGQREDAEEVAQETLLNVFQNFNQLRDPERIRPWVFRIAKNACLMKRRKSTFAPEKELSLEEFLPAPAEGGREMRNQIVDWSQVPEDQALQAELRLAVNRSISGLPEPYRSVILLRDMEELSTQEAAQILDVSEEVVRTRLHRARLALRQKLDEHLRTVPGGEHAPSRA